MLNSGDVATNGMQTLQANNTMSFKADGGFCVTPGACLPMSADNKTPLVVNVNQDNTYPDGTFYNIVVCDASAAVKSVCPAKAALPGLDPSRVP